MTNSIIKQFESQLKKSSVDLSAFNQEVMIEVILGGKKFLLPDSQIQGYITLDIEGSIYYFSSKPKFNKQNSTWSVAAFYVDLLGDFLGKIDLSALEIPQGQKFFAKCCFKLELSYLDRLNKKLNLDSLFIGALNNHLEACNK